MNRVGQTALSVGGAALIVGAMLIPGGGMPANNHHSARMAGDQQDIAAARQATARYHDINVARADGFVPRGPCIGNAYGAAGYHYVSEANVRDGVLDVTKPEIIMYAPTHDGGLRLVNLEYFKVDEDQDVSTDDDLPSLYGVPFIGPIPGRAADQPIHYEMHAWVWSENPDGMFAHVNPRLSC
ncbi:MAG TPA: hypothetical protein VK390_04230 [Propionibacteriaceae bacterium]|nr:hypothetical protein [Propionibacteriaceae bacterium]